MSRVSKSRAASVFLLWMLLESPFRLYVTGPIPNPWLNIALSLATVATIWAALRAVDFPQHPFSRTRWLLWGAGVVIVIVITGQSNG